MGKENKIVLMIYTTDDCPECAYMKSKVFHDKSVELYMNRHFVVIEKNVHTSKLPDGYDFFGIPTMFLSTKREIKERRLWGVNVLNRFWVSCAVFGEVNERTSFGHCFGGYSMCV